MNRFVRLLEGFSSSSVLVVGDLMLDEYLWGHIERISPEAPVPVLSLARRECALGGAGNVMRNLAQLGAHVSAVGVVGLDGPGEEILELLETIGIEGDGVVREARRKSTRKVRLMSLDHGQQVFRLDEESPEQVWGEAEQKVKEKIELKAAEAQVIVCSDYSKGLLTKGVLGAAFAAARRERVPVLVAPKDPNPEKYRGATLLMPNARELAQLVGSRGEQSEWVAKAGKQLVESLALEALVVTRGREGMTLFQPGPAGVGCVDIATAARSVYDVTGAGDTALAALALAVAGGADWELAAQLANEAAGVVVGKRGTATVTIEEIRKQLQREDADLPAH